MDRIENPQVHVISLNRSASNIALKLRELAADFDEMAATDNRSKSTEKST